MTVYHANMNGLEEAVMESVESQGENADQLAYVSDVLQYGCISGIVGELISYTDTHNFFDHHYDDIMELVENFESETGETVWNSEKGDLKNYLAWFAYEQTVYNLYNEEVVF